MRSSRISRPVFAFTLVSLIVLWAASLFIHTASSAQGSPTYTAEWNAQTGQFPDQACPAWGLNDTAAPENPIFSAGKLRLSTTPNSEIMDYGQFEPDISFPAATFIEARMRFVSGSSSSTNRTVASILFTTAPNVGNGLFIGQDEIFLLAAGDVRGATASVDTNDAFHTYQINIDAGGVITVLYDGVPTLTGSTWNSAANHGSVRRIVWGDVTLLANGNSDWEFVRHNAAECKPCVAAPSGMMSWWPADGHAFDIQDGNHGTLRNGATFAPGRVGQAFSLDGVNDYVEIPDSPSLTPSSITLDAWVKPSSLSGDRIIVSKYNSNNPSSNGVSWILQTSGGTGRLQFVVYQDAAGNIRQRIDTNSPALTAGVWQHVAATFDLATQAIKIYVNGVEIPSTLDASSTTITSIYDSNTPVRIGTAVNVAGSFVSFWNGLVDEVEIFNRALSAAEIQAIVSAGSSGKCKPFMALVDTKGTYLHTASDNPALPAIVNLAAGGFAPGDVVKLSYAVAPPGFSNVCGNTPRGAEQTTMLGVFSGSNTLLAPSAHPRVPDAIEAGTDFVSSPTFHGGQPTDIPQDFRLTPPSGLTIQIPAGATHLFLAVHDSLYHDNCGTVKVTIERVNRPPAAQCQNMTVSVGASCTANASIDNGSADPDGDTITITQSPAGPYPLGTTIVTLTVTDSKGATSQCAATVTVVDATPPTITAPPDVTLATGSSSAGCGAIVSEAALGTAIASDNCGTATITRSSLPAGNFFPVGTTFITYTATDASGATATATQRITINDTTPPTPDVATLPDVTGQCSATITATLTATDFCRGSVTATTTDPLTYTNQGTFIVTWTYNDLNGNTSTQTQKVIVKDAIAPTISATNQTVNTAPNSCLTSVAHGTTAADNCALASLTGTRSDGAALTDPYPRGTTTINWMAIDQAGNTATAAQTITVIDAQQPVIACSTDITAAGNITGSCAANVNVTAPTATDNCSIAAITGVRSDGQPLSAAYPLGVTTITWTATDVAGNAASCQQTVTVTNPSPVATITGPPSGSIYAVNTPVNFTGTFTDNAGGAHTATWMFDTSTHAGTVNETTGAVTTSYTFTAAGVYLVKLTVSDNCGGASTATTIGDFEALVVIYDPSVGWVTGGGWINSPAGAYVPNPSLVGKANFGFVSRYHNGATVPTGNTEFHFKAGDLKFKSTSYEWLVIAGKKAQYKGTGTINGTGSYRFMLTAVDGDLPGGDGKDKFRIRIWSDGGGLVYDNQLNAPDSDDPTTVLGGGSIVIHK